MDWIRFFESYGIEHVVGPALNVRRGCAGIACPRCPVDQGTHFSVDLETGRVRGCWRDPAHWMAPVRLVAELARVSLAEAKKVVDGESEMPTGTSPAAMLAELERTPEVGDAWVILKPEPLLETFHAFTGRSLERRFADYLAERGFHDPQQLSHDYGLRWCLSGDWARRIIFPVWRDVAGRDRVVGWTGRAIGETRKAKYKAHPPGSTMEYLLWESRRMKAGDVLVVCEGPFDALKIADSTDVTAAALLTNSAGPSKLARIMELGRMAKKTIILLDRGAEAQAMDLQRSLAVIRPTLALMPDGHKDPGDMPHKDLRRYLEGMIVSR